MSPQLKRFYTEIYLWIDAGCPKHEIFRKNLGLCGNLDNFCEIRGSSRHSLSSEMARQFQDAGLSTWYPFNYGEQVAYCQEINQRYMNPQRLQWVRQHAKI